MQIDSQTVAFEKKERIKENYKLDDLEPGKVAAKVELKFRPLPLNQKKVGTCCVPTLEI